MKKILESPLDSKDIKPVNPKGNQLWIFTDDKAEAPILWPPDGKRWFIGKDPDAGKDWRQEEKGMTEDEMVGWLHWLHGHEFEQALGVGEGHGSLACCSPWGCKESNTTERLSWTDWVYMYFSATLPIHPAPPSPSLVHKSSLCVCVSIPALEIGSSVPVF